MCVNSRDSQLNMSSRMGLNTVLEELALLRST